MRRVTRWLILFFAGLCASHCSAETIAELELLDEELQSQFLAGELIEVSDTGIRLRQQAKILQRDWLNIRSLRFNDPVSRQHATASPFVTVFFGHDEFLTGDEVTLSEDAVTLLRGKQSLEIPLSMVRHLQWDDTPRLPSALTDDIVQLRNGDVLRGEVTDLQEALRLQSRLGEISLAREQLVSVSLNEQLLRLPQSPENYLLVTLWDRSTMVVDELFLDGDSFDAKLSFGPRITLQRAQIARIDVYHACVRSAVNAVQGHQGETYFGEPFTPAKNRTLTGEFLHDGQRLPPRGFGTASYSRIELAIPATANAFRTDLALANPAAGGHVEVALLVDGTPKWRSQLHSNQPTSRAQIALDAGRVLTLLVDFGEATDFADHLLWLDPVFLFNANRPQAKSH